MCYNRLFVDSGAYSADKSGVPINIDDYMKFLHENKDKITVYANLDVIGDWAATWTNQRIMEHEGLHPLPVHHLEDPMKCLDWCLEYDYFALGGVAGGATMKTRIRFFDKCWNKICSHTGIPKSKIHGFGMAAPQLVYRYPFYSIDTSSWVSYGRFGIVILPRVTPGGVYDYSVPPVKVFVTDKSTKKGMDGVHYNTLSPQEKEAFDAYLKHQDIPFGDEDNKGVSNDNFWRDLLNYLFFTNMCKNTPEYPWSWKRPSSQTLF